MGALAFVANLVRSLAWPAVVVILCLIFREQLRTIFGTLARRLKDMATAKTPFFEVSFFRELASARQELDQMLSDPLLQATSRTLMTIPGAWAYLERTISRLADQQGIPAGPSLERRSAALMSNLHEREALASPDVAQSLVRRLKQLKHAADASQPVSPPEVYDYVSMAIWLTGALDAAAEKASADTQGSRTKATVIRGPQMILRDGLRIDDPAGFPADPEVIQ